MKSLNRYTTTLHGINSAIIKLGKLTKATKVYRGISGMALPDEFWEPNEYGVRGGVESAFMSTTLESKVAMGYAAGDGSLMGIVIEVQQGMVNRGADISWLSQYPHEREILFGPLTGIEVLRTRIDGSVVVIECAFSINLTALTLEEVLGKRRKVVTDMCEQLASKARQVAQADEWDVLRGVNEEKKGAPMAVETFLDERLIPLACEAADHYNENGPLGDAIQEGVALAEILAGWPQKLRALATGMGAASAEALVQSTEVVLLPKGMNVSQEVVKGLAALVWARPKLELVFDGLKMAPECLAVLARALRPSVTLLSLRECNFAKGGNDLSGLVHLCTALREGRAAHTLVLADNALKPDAGVLLADALTRNAALRVLECALPHWEWGRSGVVAARLSAAPWCDQVDDASRYDILTVSMPHLLQPGQEQPHQRRQGHERRAQAGGGAA
eukprot:4196501-Prymnesium_polylepis.1